MSVCLSQLRLSLQLVSLFRGVKQSPALCALLRILQAADADEKAAAYSDFLFALQAADLCFSEALLRLVFTDDNRYVRLTAAKEPIPEAMEALAERELSLFSALTELSPEDLFPDALPAGGSLARCRALKTKRLTWVRCTGRGFLSCTGSASACSPGAPCSV